MAVPSIPNNNECAVYIENGNERQSNEYGAYDFEEAIALTEIGKFHYKLILICGICFLSVMTELSGIGVILPVLACDLNASITERGLLLSAPFLGVVLSAYFIGLLADTFGRVRTLRVTLSISILFTLISAFSINMGMLIVLRLIVGFFISGSQSVIYTLCGEFHSDRSRGRHMGLISTFLPLSNIYVPTISMFILPLHMDINILGLNFMSWRFFILLNGLLSIIALIGLYTIPETPKYSLMQGDSKQALDCLQYIYGVNTGKSAENYPVKKIIFQDCGVNLGQVKGVRDGLRLIASQTAQLFSQGRWPNTLNLCFFMFILNGIIQGLYMWLPTILFKLIQNGEEHQPICHVLKHINTNITYDMTDHNECSARVDDFLYHVLLLVGCLFTVSYLCFAFLLDIVGKKRLLVIWISTVAGLLVVIHFVKQMHFNMLVLTLILNAGVCASVVSTLTVEYFPTNINAMSVGMVIMISRLGAVAGSNIVGHVIFKYCEPTFWAMFGIFVLLASLGSLLPERKKTV